MTELHRVTDGFSVAPQIAAADLARAVAAGVKLVISNRPDGEDPGQPSAAEIAAAAKAAGLDFIHIPISGAPGMAQAQAMRQAVADAPGPVLAFCRSGTRSIMTWALGEALAGERTRDELVALGHGAGYDLDRMLPRF